MVYEEEGQCNMQKILDAPKYVAFCGQGCGQGWRVRLGVGDERGANEQHLQHGKLHSTPLPEQKLEAFCDKGAHSGSHPEL